MGIEIVTVTLKRYTCEKCGYSWLQRDADAPEPKNCANKDCKSPIWNKPRAAARNTGD